MIIIDQDTDRTLANTLEKFRAEEKHARCIYFRLSNQQTADVGFKDKLVASAKQHIATIDTQVFLCGDGDIFILAPTIPSKGRRDFILDIATYTCQAASDEWVQFVELPLHINKLLIVIEAKLEKHRKAEEEKKKQAEQALAERKRQAILSGGMYKHSDIKEKRANRETPEMMIIEDDAFSRRLVENVLQKRYPLTGLGEATYALDTYTRVAPDLLFLDINLPDVTGHELLEKIIALDPEAYVIMLSGNCDRENITQAMSRGAKGFVAKPFTKDKLFQYIERCPTIKS
ncbi:MAG: response regulator [Rickettsiales bacterium]|nr:response regulator [Rickettsiales bacterium]